MQSHLDRVQMRKNQEGRRTTLLGGKGLALTPPGGKKGPCYFHNHGGCSKTDAQCKFEHVDLPAAEKAKMKKPAGKSQSPPPQPQGGRPTRDRKGAESGGPGSSATAPGRLCHYDLKGKCTRGDKCPFIHSPKEETERTKRSERQHQKPKQKPKQTRSQRKQPA